jgi:hypothetical protein
MCALRLRLLAALSLAAIFATCCGRVSNTSATSHTIEARVNALENETTAWMDLGTPYAVRTTNTLFIVEQKEAAVPFLVQALKEKSKPVKVAYAAFCLRELNSPSGNVVARKAYSKLLANKDHLSADERFAMRELGNYLAQTNK